MDGKKELIPNLKTLYEIITGAKTQDFRQYSQFCGQPSEEKTEAISGTLVQNRVFGTQIMTGHRYLDFYSFDSSTEPTDREACNLIVIDFGPDFENQYPLVPSQSGHKSEIH